jgi:DNA-binding FrmR family transcriptional regulator
MTPMRTEIKTSCLKRLKRIEGQIRGLAGMVEDDRYCIDVVTQIAAAKAALRRVEEEILRPAPQDRRIDGRGRPRRPVVRRIGARMRAAWFETRGIAALLTMRG